MVVPVLGYLASSRILGLPPGKPIRRVMPARKLTVHTPDSTPRHLAGNWPCATSRYNRAGAGVGFDPAPG